MANTSEGELLSVLRKSFKRNEFRSNQSDVIKAVLAHKDVTVILPTGHGKSLTFQSPAVVESSFGSKGFYIVISPSLALMKDQVRQLQALGINADTINSTSTSVQRQQIIQRFLNGNGCLLYVSPEQCFTERFGSFVKSCSSNGLIKRIVIDEAHCAVEWGADFRKDYAKLGSEFRAKLSHEVPFMALTGTASPRMHNQIKKILRLKNSKDFRSSSRRPHLHYEVRYIEEPQEKLRDILQFSKMYRGRVIPQDTTNNYPGCGIIYCRSRASTESIAAEINRILGQCAVTFHAGLSSSERTTVMTQWVEGNPKYAIVIATIAFGMGIDKPDTRFVIHFDLPSNIEAYAQQTGRGGRDRKAARCILYFSANEARKCIAFAKPGDAKQSALASIRFATTITRCRHDVLGEYFGDRSEGSCEYACDFCKMPQRSRVRYDEWNSY